MGNLTHTMTNRRYAEACVGYAESHDQVGGAGRDCGLRVGGADRRACARCVLHPSLVKALPATPTHPIDLTHTPRRWRLWCLAMAMACWCTIVCAGPTHVFDPSPPSNTMAGAGG